MTSIWEIAPFILGVIIELTTPLNDFLQDRILKAKISASSPRPDDELKKDLLTQSVDYAPYVTLTSDLAHLGYTFIVVIFGYLFVRLSHVAQIPDLEMIAYVFLFFGVFVLGRRFLKSNPEWYCQDTFLLPERRKSSDSGQGRGVVNVRLRRIPQLCILLNLLIALVLTIIRNPLS